MSLTHVYARAVGNQSVTGFGKQVIDRLYATPQVREVRLVSSERLFHGEQVVTVEVALDDMPAGEAEEVVVERLSWRGIVAAAAHDSKCRQCFGHGRLPGRNVNCSACGGTGAASMEGRSATDR